MITLEPDQQEIVDAVRAKMLEGKKRILICAQTGSGKTVMGSYILRNAQTKGSSTWFTVPRKQLLKQTAVTYEAFDIRHSYIASGKYHNPRALNNICSLQTLPKRLHELTPPKLAIVDEQHFGGGQLKTVMDWLVANDCYIIGLSATPMLANGDGLDMWFDDMVMGLGLRELIDLGRLSDYKIFAPSRPDLSSVKVSNGEFVKSSLAEWMGKHGKVLIGDTVQTYKTHAMGKRGITFCTSIEESQKMAEAYRQAGVPAEHMDGETPQEMREYYINAYANRDILQLCNVDLMTFGFDLAAQVGRDVVIEVMSDAAPTKSIPKQRQKWGRVLRWKPEPALIFDHVGNVFEHGLPCDMPDWTLEGRERKIRGAKQEQTVKMKQCSSCYFCHPPAPTCPNCGHEYPVESRTIKQVEGELEEITQVDNKAKRMEVGQAKTFADLERIARERGYKRGWIYNIAKAKGIRI